MPWLKLHSPMKLFLSFFILALLFSCNNKETPIDETANKPDQPLNLEKYKLPKDTISHSALKALLDSTSLDGFEIEHSYGCDDLTVKRMKFKNDNDQLKAYILEPHYYYGRKTDSVWETALDSHKIVAIKEYIKHSRNLVDYHCESQSTLFPMWQTFYKDRLLFMVEGEENFERISYDSLEQIVFKEHFADLELKRSGM